MLISRILLFGREYMESTTATPNNKRFHFEFLLPLFVHPRTTFEKIVQKRGTWLTPLLIISLLTIARVMLVVPTAAAPAMPLDMPPDGRPVVPGKGQAPQGNYTPISTNPQKGGGGGGEGEIPPPDASGGSIAGNVVPAIGATISIWAGWFILSVLLYVGMVISGSNNSFTETLNLTAWASLPLAIRQVVMLVAALAAPSVTANPTGLSALSTSVAGPLGMFLTVFLKPIDVYLVWQTILIVVGLRQVSPLTLGRIVGITLSALVIYLVLAAMPGFLGTIFAQLTAPTPGGYYGG
jgi:hypothetical protein